MKTVTCLVFGLMIFISIKAQDITRIEYFFDTDPGFGNGIPVNFTPDSIVTAAFITDITGIASGLHMLCIRALNEGNLWSILSSRLFAAFDYSVIQDISQMEYFVDNDPGYGNGKPVIITPGKNVTQSFVIDLTGVSPGIHKLITRCRNSVGQWSQIGHYLFNAVDLSIGDVVQMEYFVDSDPGYGHATPIIIIPGNHISNVFTPDLTGLSPGIHLLCLRSKNSFNRWSQVEYSMVLNEDADLHMITKLEYYLTRDPGFGKGKGVAVIPAAELTSNFILDTNNIVAGSYWFVSRVMNDAARWSIISSKHITVKTKIWTGTSDVDWKVPENWDPMGVPLSTDKIIIPTGALRMPVVKESGHSCHDISIGDGARLDLDPGVTLEITGDIRIEKE
jgi:hypothetical protein